MNMDVTPNVKLSSSNVDMSALRREFMRAKRRTGPFLESSVSVLKLEKAFKALVRRERILPFGAKKMGIKQCVFAKQ